MRWLLKGGGILTLVESVLEAISVYLHSLAHIPKKCAGKSKEEGSPEVMKVRRDEEDLLQFIMEGKIRSGWLPSVKIAVHCQAYG